MHCNNLGMAGNVDSIIDTIDAAQEGESSSTYTVYGYADEEKRVFIWSVEIS